VEVPANGEKMLGYKAHYSWWFGRSARAAGPCLRTGVAEKKRVGYS
jgi:hypothetical protein